MSAPSHKALIEAIGSGSVRSAYGLSRQRLFSWKTRGVPHAYRVAVAKLAAERGVVVPADFFEGMVA